jgi:hypothetical protein
MVRMKMAEKKMLNLGHIDTGTEKPSYRAQPQIKKEPEAIGLKKKRT